MCCEPLKEVSVSPCIYKHNAAVIQYNSYETVA